MKPIALLCISGVALLSCCSSKSKPTATADDANAAAKEDPLSPTEKQAASSENEAANPSDEDLVRQFETLMKQARSNFDQVSSVAKEFDGDCVKAGTRIISMGIDGAAIDTQGRAISAALAERPHLRERIQRIATSVFPPELQETVGESVSKMETQCASDPQFQSALRKSGGEKVK